MVVGRGRHRHRARRLRPGDCRALGLARGGQPWCVDRSRHARRQQFLDADWSRSLHGHQRLLRAPGPDRRPGADHRVIAARTAKRPVPPRPRKGSDMNAMTAISQSAGVALSEAGRAATPAEAKAAPAEPRADDPAPAQAKAPPAPNKPDPGAASRSLRRLTIPLAAVGAAAVLVLVT